ncbi:MAG: hypothetical protein ACREGF_05930, partial [Candidatus Saccharimonadales bacterium]
MAQLLSLLLISFAVTGALLIPFINLLYKIKLRRRVQETKDPFNDRTQIFDRLHGWKVGTPFGGGILIITVVTILLLATDIILKVHARHWELFVVLFTFLGYGVLGLYDDLRKLVDKHDAFFGLRIRYKFLIQWILAFVIAFVLYDKLGYSFIFVHGVG